jgi:hypothetical protein
LLKKGVVHVDSSLNIPDDGAWHLLPDYSPLVASRLRRAYARIAGRRDRVASYVKATLEVAPCLPLKMADPQLLRVFYIEALGHSAANRSREALEWIDTALELAIELDDQSALVALLYLRGAENASLLHYSEAVTDFEDSRVLLRGLSLHGQPIDASMELHLTTRQAILRFFLGQYALTEQLQDEARHVLPFISDPGLDVAAIQWIEAHLFRWRGEPERALRPALAAAQMYAQWDAAGSAARIETVAADVILDLCASLPQGTDRDALLVMAEPHLTRALDFAQAIGNELGVVLTRLTQVRWHRLRGDNVDRLGAIEQLAQTAQRRSDHALLAQAFTTRGDELLTLGEADAARACYRQVLAILDGSDVSALGVWARRALHQMDREFPHV